MRRGRRSGGDGVGSWAHPEFRHHSPPWQATDAAAGVPPVFAIIKRARTVVKVGGKGRAGACDHGDRSWAKVARGKKREKPQVIKATYSRIGD